MSRTAPRRLRPILALALLGCSAAAWADHPFILPSSTSYSGENNVVTFDAAGSDHVFFFDHRPIQLNTIKIVKPDGTPGTPYNATQTRFRSVLDLRLDQPGTWRVSSDQMMVTGTVKVNGEERRVGGRGGPRPGQGGPGQGGPGQGGQGGDRGGDGGQGRPAGDRTAGAGGGDRSGAPGQQGDDRGGGQNRGSGAQPGGGERRPPTIALADVPATATDVHLTETVSRTETFVTVDGPTTTVFTPTGKGLEFVPITHPNAIAAGETARFRFLVDGKPAAGVKVTVVPGGDRYRAATDEMGFTTDAGGVVAIKWPAAGLYWLGAEAEDHHPAETRADTRRMSYAATLEVMTP